MQNASPTYDWRWVRHTRRCRPGRRGLGSTALRGVQRYRAALRPLHAPDVGVADHGRAEGMPQVVDAQRSQARGWMGHAGVQTTMRDLHDAPRHDDAAIVGRAFGSECVTAGEPGASR